MLKFIFYFLLFITVVGNVQAGRRKKTPRSESLEEPWTGTWFPHDPSDKLDARAGQLKVTPRPDSLEEPWTGTWFPHDPSDKLDARAGQLKVTPRPDSLEEPWTGMWFPHDPSDKQDVQAGRRKGTLRPETLEEPWTGIWFPHGPSDKPTKETKPTTNICDDGKHEIYLDFDPANKTHSFNYLCLNNRTLYAPNLDREAVLTEHFIPHAYVAPIKCMNESISYESELPTFGPHRLLAPKYGKYRYLPPHRWLRSLADGGIVMLFHPCVFPRQMTALENTLKGCLYRHIITPSQHLTPERPLALLSWGKLLQMSVVDEHIVVDFIKQNSKHGPNAKKNEVLTLGLYEAGLLSEASLVTDEEDSEICGFKNM